MRKKVINRWITMLCIISVFLCWVGGVSWGKKIELVYSYWGSTVEKEAVETMINEFNKLQPNIKAKGLHIPQNYAMKLQTMIAAGNAPDVMKMGQTSFRDWADRNAYLELNPFLEEDPDVSLETWARVKVENYTVDGKFYGVSGCLEPMLIFYREDLFDEAGVSYPPAEEPWTWDEFLSAAKKLTKEEGGQITQYGVETADRWLINASYVLANGGKVFNESVTETLLAEPEAVEALQRLVDLELKHRVDPQSRFLQLIGAGSLEALGTGRVAMLMEGHWVLGDLAQMEFPLNIGVIPKMKDFTYLDVSSTTVISKDTKYPKEAWELFKHANIAASGIVPLCQYGIWVPSVKSLLFTPEGRQLWLTEGMHPSHFVEAVLATVLHATRTPATLTDGMEEIIGKVLTPTFDKIWLGEISVKKGMEEAALMINEILAR